MHWFWRAAIAVVVSFVLMNAIGVGLFRFMSVDAFKNVPLQIGLSLARYVMPLIVFGLLTWWRDRRCIPPGHCQNCGYNLTGNVSGVCPECGVEVRRGRLAGVSHQSDGT